MAKAKSYGRRGPSQPHRTRQRSIDPDKRRVVTWRLLESPNHAMHWILQTNLFKETEWDQLVATLERFGLPYSVHKVIPFIGQLEPVPQVEDDWVICMGSYSMRHAAREFGWTPGVYDLFEQDFTQQKVAWGERMLNADSQVVEFQHARLDGPTFIRPIDDSKYFTGRVFEPEEFADWQQKVCVLEEDFGNSLRKDTRLQLSMPKAILTEARIWVVDGQIVTHSTYKRGTRVLYTREVDPHLLEFAQAAVDDWQPHRAFVIDVCDTDQGPKIVEINTLNSAGFYAGDVQKLVLALEDMECQPAPTRRETGPGR